LKSSDCSWSFGWRTWSVHYRLYQQTVGIR
jgi:hypothetical protein